MCMRSLGRGYAWLDIGTMDSLFGTWEFVRIVPCAQGPPIAIVEEIAENGWITRDQLMESAERYGKSPYDGHLRGHSRRRNYARPQPEELIRLDTAFHSRSNQCPRRRSMVAANSAWRMKSSRVQTA